MIDFSHLASSFMFSLIANQRLMSAGQTAASGTSLPLSIRINRERWLLFRCRQLANRNRVMDRMDQRRAKQADFPLRHAELSCWRCLKVTEDYALWHVALLPDKELPPLRLYCKVLASWPSSRQPVTNTEPLFAGEIMIPLLRLQDILIHGSQMIRTRDMFTDPRL